MKKVTMINPNVREGFVANSNIKGERYRYLHIDPNYSKHTLEHDIGAGAKQFMSVKETLDKKRYSHYYLIDCNNEEEGLMAVTYLESVYIGKGDYNSLSYDLDYFEEEYEGVETLEDWADYVNNIPIITINELHDYLRQYNNYDMFLGNRTGLANGRPESGKPYWTKCRTNPICVIFNEDWWCGEERIKDLELFQENANVYVLNIVNESNVAKERKYHIDTDDELDDWLVDCSFFGGGGLTREERIRYQLEYNPNTLRVALDEEQRKKVDEFYFRQLCMEYGVKKGKDVKIDLVMKQIRFVEKQYPKGFLRKILNRVLILDPECNILTTKHFAELGIISDNVAEKTKKRNLDELIGIESVKKQINDFMSMQKYQKFCMENGGPYMDFHNVLLFFGAPGTAKTTCARILGEMMREERLLKGDRFVSVSGAELKGAYVGQTAPKVHELFCENDIIFIDEAYSLTATDRAGEIDTYSQEALAQLAIELENHSSDKLIIFAGYGGKEVNGKNNKMKQFLESNPGIRSRVNKTIYFPSYQSTEMAEIVKGIIKQKGLVLDKEDQAVQYILFYFQTRADKEDFGNGREARSFVEHCFAQLANRMMQLAESKRTKRMMKSITLQDVKETIKELENSSKMQDGRNVAFGLM